MGDHPNISLIYVNYRSARRLEDALKSLFSYENRNSGPFEIIVSNNDVLERDLVERLREKYGFLLLQNKENQGFGVAANIGARRASGKIIGFLNPDTCFREQCLEGIREAFEKDPALGVLGMRLFRPSGEAERWSFGRWPTLGKILAGKFFQKKNEQLSGNEDDRETDWVSGAALFVRKSLFLELSGFDEDFFLYFEDVDFCQRVSRAGYKRRLSRFSLLHFGGTSQHSSREQKKHYYRSQERYFKKYRPWREYIVLRIFRFFRYGR